jgi:hypothetical protein
MSEAPEDLHHRLDQLRLLASETDDPLAERLVRDMISGQWGPRGFSFARFQCRSFSRNLTRIGNY